MAEVHYFIIRPDGNTTAVVKDAIPVDRYAELAILIMGGDAKVEQVAFMEKASDARADIKMVMMGGEFCANAVRCAAFLHNKNGTVLVETDFEDLVEVVTDGKSAEIRLPGTYIRQMTETEDGHLVEMQGITHLITEVGRGVTLEGAENTEPDAEELALVEKYIGDSPAFGIIRLREEGENYAMLPSIFVRDTASFIFETACASGSIAAAAVIFASDKKAADSGNESNYAIVQPSGKIYSVVVKADKSEISEISLRSDIEYLGEGGVEFKPD